MVKIYACSMSFQVTHFVIHLIDILLVIKSGLNLRVKYTIFVRRIVSNDDEIFESI